MAGERAPAGRRPPAGGVFAVLASVSLLVYGWVLRAPYVWEDEITVLANRHVQEGSPLFDVFLQRHWEGSGSATIYYRPMVDASLMFDHFLAPRNPAACHVSSVLWHALAAQALYLLLLASGSTAGVALLGAGLFAAHPVHVESVAYISNRHTVLAAVFVLWSFVFWLRWRASGAGKSLAAAGACALAGFCSKESAVALPVLVTLHELLGGRADRRERRVWGGLGLLWAVLAGYEALRLRVLGLGLAGLAAPGGTDEAFDPSLFGRLATSIRVIGDCLRLFVWPSGLHSDRWTELSTGWLDPRAVASALALGLIVYAARRLRESRPWAALGLAGYLVCLLPVLNIVPLKPIMAERFAYLPYAWLILALAQFAPAWEARWRPGLGAALMGVWIGALALGTAFQSRHWRSLEAVARRTLSYNPRSFSMHTNLGVEAFRRGDLDGAEAAFAASLGVKPGYAPALNNLGAVRGRRGDPAGALAYYEAAVRADPGYVLARGNRAKLLLLAGRVDEARREYQTILAIFPRDPEAQAALSRLSAGSAARR